MGIQRGRRRGLFRARLEIGGEMVRRGVRATALFVAGATACAAWSWGGPAAVADDGAPAGAKTDGAGVVVPAAVADLGVVAQPVAVEDSPIASAVGAALTLDYGPGQQIGVGLPTDGGLEAEGSYLVADDADHGLTVVPTAEGAQVVVGLNGPDAPTAYGFDLDVPEGFVPELTPDGAVAVRDTAGAEAVYVAKPWAYDAEGVPVPTRFEVAGTTVTQVVEHVDGGFAYPISADPRIKACNWRTATCVTFSKSETRAIARQTGNAAGIAALCGFIPHVAIRVGCAVAFVPVWNSVKGTFSSASKQGRCVEVKLNALPPAYNLPIGWKVVSC